MKFFHFIEQDKKLLIKVIAGIILLVIAFSVYVIKEVGQEQISLSVIPDEGTENEITTDSALEKEKTVIIVDVAGAVASPSVVELPDGSRVFEAVEKAGGFTVEADTSMINQAEILTDGQKIYIPTKQEIRQLQSTEEGTASVNSIDPSGTHRSGLVNINTADSAALQQLTGVGPATAEKIIDYRNQNGKFKTIEELKNVSGIGEKTFEKFKDKIKV